MSAIEQQLQELSKRVAALEANFDITITNIVHTVGKVLHVSYEETWINKSLEPLCIIARQRAWYVLHLLGHSYESIGAYTGFSTYLVRNGIMAYTSKLEEQYLAETNPS